MNLFSKAHPKANPKKIRQLKAWIYELLELNGEIPVSISQLHCTEPGCPPLETVIAVMTNPAKQYKIHKSIDAIGYADIFAAIKSK